MEQNLFDPRVLQARLEQGAEKKPHFKETKAHILSSLVEVNIAGIKNLNNPDTHVDFEKSIRGVGYVPGLEHNDVEPDPEAAFWVAMAATAKMWHEHIFPERTRS